jgi:hypothetical protein
MKRDQDLIRDILLRVEAGDAKTRVDLHFEGRDQREVMYNAGLLHQSKWVKGYDFSSTDRSDLDYALYDLTPEGHEFLEVARSESIWNQAKNQVKPLGGVTLDILKSVLTEIMKKQVGL